MESGKIDIRYLPLFYDDLERSVMYIAVVLQNGKAADDLLFDVEKAIRERAACPEAFEPYHSARERQHPYYRIYARNYTVYYVVLEENGRKIMEIRRFLHNRQNVRTII